MSKKEKTVDWDAEYYKLNIKLVYDRLQYLTKSQLIEIKDYIINELEREYK